MHCQLCCTSCTLSNPWPVWRVGVIVRMSDLWSKGCDFFYHSFHWCLITHMLVAPWSSSCITWYLPSSWWFCAAGRVIVDGNWQHIVTHVICRLTRLLIDQRTPALVRKLVPFVKGLSRGQARKWTGKTETVGSRGACIPVPHRLSLGKSWNRIMSHRVTWITAVLPLVSFFAKGSCQV